jgi:hypothetical protein
MAAKSKTQVVEVRVLFTAGCPATPETLELVTDVASSTQTPIKLEKILIESPEQALDLKFLGSPTVQVNGLDVDPAARSNTAYGFT